MKQTGMVTMTLARKDIFQITVGIKIKGVANIVSESGGGDPSRVLGGLPLQPLTLRWSGDTVEQ
jgi:hypothetical protein